MSPKLQELLAPQRIRFQHIPPNAPHFGGTWEREVKSVKIALRVILREQVVPEPALQTLLVEVEGILNTKPLGYERHKWRKDGKELSVGQVVLIVDSQLPRALWPVGKVTETLAGPDGKIHTARVRVHDTSYTRPVVRLIPLPRLEDQP
ncbi:uncharacterized protein LOC113069085 [Tachysurus ichikawai]